MITRTFKSFLVAIAVMCLASGIRAQNVTEPKSPAEWTRTFAPFRIAGNLYYVGTYDLACYLITTSKGNILINTGLASSAQNIKKNIETLGFRFADTRILLTTQAHYDHVGAMADIKNQTGAILMADAADAEALATGGRSDYEMGKYGVTFKPVTADTLLHDGDSVVWGGMKLTLLHHPGHTKGSCSYLFTVKDDQRSCQVLIANLPSIITDKPFAEISAYPTIAGDYAYTLQAMKNIRFDIWLASHASQFNLHGKHKPGDACNPMAFSDQPSYEAALNTLRKQYEEKLRKDAGSYHHQ